MHNAQQAMTWRAVGVAKGEGAGREGVYAFYSINTRNANFCNLFTLQRLHSNWFTWSGSAAGSDSSVDVVGQHKVSCCCWQQQAAGSRRALQLALLQLRIV